MKYAGDNSLRAATCIQVPRDLYVTLNHLLRTYLVRLVKSVFRSMNTKCFIHLKFLKYANSPLQQSAAGWQRKIEPEANVKSDRGGTSYHLRHKLSEIYLSRGAIILSLFSLTFLIKLMKITTK